jgi:hypothetical protein
MGSGRGDLSVAGVVVAALLSALDDDFLDRGGESNFLDDHHDLDAGDEGDRWLGDELKSGDHRSRLALDRAGKPY